MPSKKKHVLEYFQKDHWGVRVGVLAMWLTFLLALAGSFSGALADWPALTTLLKRFT